MSSTSSALPSGDPSVYRAAMRRCANTVGIIATGSPGNRVGFTATSYASLSDTPPSLMVGVGRHTSSHGRLSVGSMFGLSILALGQEEVSDLFAGRRGIHGEDRFADPRWLSGSAAPIYAGAIVAIECVVSGLTTVHTHNLLIADVMRVHLGAKLPPLLYMEGGYINYLRLASRSAAGPLEIDLARAST